jgi:PAS domain S-box-containing protein
MRKMSENTIWASSKMRELFGFSDAKPVTLEVFIQKIHPDDRQNVLDVWKKAETGGSGYHTEYRVLLDNGQIRWIDSRGKVEFYEGKPKLIHGASMDITERKTGEENVHKFSRMLMDAQENERVWLARELHDDLSQRLALLSIQLAELRADEIKPGYLNEKVDSLTSQIQHLSADIHRISHDLHPAKLNQLGLGAALRSFCREIAAVHPVKIEFTENKNLPQFLAEDVSLCLYRITQEALQNAIKHSAASRIRVSVKVEGDEIRLLISDNGCGFDIEGVKAKETLGLISIKERIRAVKGIVQIESKIGTGTKIEAHVPLDRAVQG